MLLLMVIFGLAWRNRSAADANFDTNTSFSKTPQTPTGVYRFAEALVFVLFSFSGFHQANYVSTVMGVTGESSCSPNPTGARRSTKPPQELCLGLWCRSRTDLPALHGDQHPLRQPLLKPLSLLHETLTPSRLR
jgi:hypothetical protein